MDSSILDNFVNIKFNIHGSKEDDTTEFPNLNSIKFNTTINDLNVIKSKIDSIGDKDWDYFKKKCNPFECVTTNGGLANYTPISRAYYKMLEITTLFRDVLEHIDPDRLTTLHLAEGPGGFMECINNVLKEMNYKDFKMYGMTLLREERSIPAWKKTSYFLEYNKHVEILKGKDGTGDLYNIDNIYDIMTQMKTKATIITGDGGFDFSNDFNQQESMSFPLLYCQSLAALLCQKKGGIFILKFFDTYQLKTLQLLCLLNKCYKSIHFVKPYTSRPANSEKYLVCVGFLDNISEREIYKLLLDIPKIGSTINNSLEISKYNTKDMTFYNSINIINRIMFSRQREFIHFTLDIIKNNNLEEKKEELFKRQILTSSEWCERYGIKINYQSKFLNSYSRIHNTFEKV
jgi:23S rRNA U2552 (ribose-2'-O)-methylase RlmE/FtsJ